MTKKNEVPREGSSTTPDARDKNLKTKAEPRVYSIDKASKFRNIFATGAEDRTQVVRKIKLSPSSYPISPKRSSVKSEKPFKCKYCVKTYTLKNSLRRHLQTHIETQHKCHLCGKIFENKSKLEDHVRSHTVERPFKCEVCSKSFTQKSNRNRHMRNVHLSENTSTNKVHECMCCGSAFISPSELSRHLKSHGVGGRGKCSTCMYCYEKFSTTRSLRSHLRKEHSDEMSNSQSS